MHYTKDTIRNLLDRKLPWEMVKNIMSSPKDEDRLRLVREIEQERVPWKERILLALAEHLYIVKKGSALIVKCGCGFEFGDCSLNWKLEALVYERNPQDGEIYVPRRACDPEWMVLREFYCPGCQAQLEVEAVPPGYPFVFDFRPDPEALQQLAEENKDAES
ncbi:MAG: acetone carboxylase subunit gamma [bacterium]